MPVSTKREETTFSSDGYFSAKVIRVDGKVYRVELFLDGTKTFDIAPEEIEDLGALLEEVRLYVNAPGKVAL
jgi:hypothetical protein